MREEENGWELIPKKNRGGIPGGYGGQWTESPCVVVNKHGFTFNRKFMQYFGVIDGTILNVFHNVKLKSIRFQVATLPIEIEAGYKVRYNHKIKASATITCAALVKNLPIQNATPFQANLVSGTRMIEASYAGVMKSDESSEQSDVVDR